MKTLWLAVALCAPLWTVAARPVAGAQNHILVSSGGHVIPLATVRNGVFESLSLKNDEVKTQPEQDQAGAKTDVLLKGESVYGYLDGRFVGTTTITSVRIAQDETEVDEVRLLAPKDQAGAPARLFTTLPLPNSVRSSSRKPTDAEAADAGQLVRSVLAKRRVPQSAWATILKQTETKVVSLARGEGEVLLISSNGPIYFDYDRGIRWAAALLLIGERGNGIAFRPTLIRLFWGRSGESLVSWTVLDHADLDGDGTDELIYEELDWETLSHGLLRRQSGVWQTVELGNDGESEARGMSFLGGAADRYVTAFNCSPDREVELRKILRAP